MQRRYRHRKLFKHFIDIVLPLILILVGAVLIIAATPPWFWLFLLGIALIVIGSSILKK